MLEFHVDNAEYFNLLGNKQTYGGDLSVRCDKTKYPLILIGQDKCGFYQYCRHSKQWVGPTGERSLLPKTRGASIMRSAM